MMWFTQSSAEREEGRTKQPLRSIRGEGDWGCLKLGAVSGNFGSMLHPEQEQLLPRVTFKYKTADIILIILLRSTEK